MSVGVGRDYLVAPSHQRKLLTALTQAVRTHALNDAASANCIATLQKLSLRSCSACLTCQPLV